MKTKKRLRNGPIIVLLGFLCALLFGLATTALASPPDHAVPIPIDVAAYVAPPNQEASAVQNTLNLDVVANYAIPNDALSDGSLVNIANSSAINVFNDSAGVTIVANAAPPANTAGINSSPHNSVTANYTNVDMANYANTDSTTRATANQAANLRKGGFGHESALTASGVILVVIENGAPIIERMACFGAELATSVVNNATRLGAS